VGNACASGPYPRRQTDRRYRLSTKPLATMHRLLCFFLLAGVSVLSAQTSLDSTQTAKSSRFSSIGFNVSSVSGMGLSYRNQLTTRSLFQVTGGVLTTDKRTSYSFGLEYQYQLSKSPSFRYYLAGAAGVYSDITTKEFAGFGLGLEIPIVGPTIFYPAFNLSGKTQIGIGASVYVYYNF
jgi:hypothetical protein